MNFGSHNSIFVGSVMSSPTTSPVPSLDEISMIDMEKSPKRSRVVSTCRNCAMTFRVNCKSIGEFCSKDCHTTFTVFGKQESSYCRTPDKSAAEVRTAIYQFQKHIDNESSQSSTVPTEAADALAPTVVVKAPVTTPPMIKKHNIFGNIFSSNSSTSSPVHFSASRPRRPIATNFF